MLANILLTIVLPLFLLIGIGVLLDRTFHLDVITLNRLNFYVFAPALVFSTAYASDLAGAEIGGIALFTLVHHIVMAVLALVVFSLPEFSPDRPALTLGAVVYNAGIYGIPLMLLAFGQRAVSIISIVLTVQQLLLFSFGLALFVGLQEGGLRTTLLQILRYPVLYAVAVGLAMRGLHIGLPGAVQSVLDYLMGGFVGVSLITLGAQLSRCPMFGDTRSISAVMILRFAISPLLAALMVVFFPFDAQLNAVLIVGAALPSAVNVYMLAREVNRSADLASRMVFWTTVLSAAAIPMVLLLAD